MSAQTLPHGGFPVSTESSRLAYAEGRLAFCRDLLSREADRLDAEAATDERGAKEKRKRAGVLRTAAAA